MSVELTRRQWLAGTPAAVGLGLTAGVAAGKDERRDRPFRFCLNTSTIRGQKLTLPQQVDVAARAGYQAIEPWIGEIDQYVKGGGSLPDLGKRIRDLGLTVEDAIGFPEWAVDDEPRRKKGLEEARRCMDLVRQLGGKRIAAPPAGATNVRLDPAVLAPRYRALLEVGDQMGVVPQVEVWGFAKTLSQLGEAALVAIESRHPRACVLADAYHLHKGGSGFTGLPLLSGDALQVFHINDYPAEPPRARITDADRIYPGDGVAPLKEMLRAMYRAGFRGVLSLELFNRTYWKQDPFTVVRTGLEKMHRLVDASLAG